MRNLLTVGTSIMLLKVSTESETSLRVRLLVGWSVCRLVGRSVVWSVMISSFTSHASIGALVNFSFRVGLKLFFTYVNCWLLSF